MCIEDGYREHHMPKSHKRWTSYELMLKRVKKRPYMIEEVWRRSASNTAHYVTSSSPEM